MHFCNIYQLQLDAQHCHLYLSIMLNKLTLSILCQLVGDFKIAVATQSEEEALELGIIVHSFNSVPSLII